MGEPVWEAKKKCPDGVYVKRDFRWYETLSSRMLAAVGTFSPQVEYYSIDEFFWAAQRARNQSYRQTAEAIREHIKRSTGLPCLDRRNAKDTQGIALGYVVSAFQAKDQSGEPHPSLTMLHRDALLRMDGFSILTPSAPCPWP
jgi:hypothetical protein